MEMGNKPEEDPSSDPEEALSGELDWQSERLMEKLLATCLALPRHRMDLAIAEACEKHPTLAPYLRHRYSNLLQMGILELHDEEDLQGEYSQ